VIPAGEGSTLADGECHHSKMDRLLYAIERFAEYLGSIGWGAVALALAFHLLKVVTRTRAWRNVITASYPDAGVRWRTVLGAYSAGVGANAILPARSGDLLKLYLLKHRVEGATYPTLGSTLVVEAIFDTIIAAAVLVWALSIGVVPALDAVPSLPSVDWFWLLDNPATTLIVLTVIAALGFSLFLLAAERIDAFRERVAQGFAVLRDPVRYLRGVVAWQALSWLCRLATLYFFLRAFGVHANVENALLAQVAQSLAGILPITPAGIGTTQALLVLLLAGEAPTRALVSFSAGMELILIAANVVLGFLALVLMARTFRWRRLLHREPGLAREEA
jgi:uncharacterized protein (TIRG00374 family)